MLPALRIEKSVTQSFRETTKQVSEKSVTRSFRETTKHGAPRCGGKKSPRPCSAPPRGAPGLVQTGLPCLDQTGDLGSTNTCNCRLMMIQEPIYLIMDVKRCSDLRLGFDLAAAFLTVNTLVAIVRMREDILAVTFTISFFVFMMIFFWCLTVFEKLPQDSKEKERLKPPIWILATSLNFMFAYRVRTLIQPGMVLGWLVLGMAGTTSVITFYFFFVYGGKKSKTGDCNSKVLHAQQV